MQQELRVLKVIKVLLDYREQLVAKEPQVIKEELVIKVLLESKAQLVL